jgi:hypothetical protein
LTSTYKRVPVIDKSWANSSSSGKLIPHTIRDIVNTCRKNRTNALTMVTDEQYGTPNHTHTIMIVSSQCVDDQMDRYNILVMNSGMKRKTPRLRRKGKTMLHSTYHSKIASDQKFLLALLVHQI